MSMTSEQMKAKLQQWKPQWNLERFTPKQIAALYRKETLQMVKAIESQAIYRPPKEPNKYS